VPAICCENSTASSSGKDIFACVYFLTLPFPLIRLSDLKQVIEETLSKVDFTEFAKASRDYNQQLKLIKLAKKSMM
jgi:hypothetical protein